MFTKGQWIITCVFFYTNFHLSIKSDRKSSGVHVDVSAFDIHFLDLGQVLSRAFFIVANLFIGVSRVTGRRATERQSLGKPDPSLARLFVS